MESNTIFTVCILVLLLSSSSSSSQTIGSQSLSPWPSPSPSLIQKPAPAPVAGIVDLKDLLSLAGPFSTFLNYIESTKVLQTFQNRANETKQGITIFVPKDTAFSSLKKHKSLLNLTQEQLKLLLLFHSLPNYYALADFKILSKLNPVSTLAGNQYTLNFTDKSGTVYLNSGWTNTKITSSVHSTSPVAVYQIEKVLIPEALFGQAPLHPPSSAPSSSIDIGMVSDSTPKSSSYRVLSSSGLVYYFMAISGGVILLL